MMKCPKVSVVIPAYNAAVTIRGTLNSFFSQSFRDFEIIVVNDGSTDRTYEICELLKKDSHIPLHVYIQPNRGGANARNRGIELSQGKYIIFMDADDIVEKDFIKKLVNAIESKSIVDIACCSFDLLYEDGGSKPRIIKSAKKVLSGKEALIHLLREELEVWSGSAMYSRYLLTRFNVFFDEDVIMGEDIDFRWRAFYHARQVALVPDILVHYIQHSSSITRALDPNRFPPSSWLDPHKFLSYLEAMGEKDEDLLQTLRGYVIPLFTVRRLRNYITYDIEDLFWDSLKIEEIRNTLKRGLVSFKYNPGLALKCFLLLCYPKAFYDRYKFNKGQYR